MNLANFKQLSTVELRETEGGGRIGTAIRIIKEGYKKAKSHIDDFIEGWNEG